jgi:hypothetical protein
MAFLNTETRHLKPGSCRVSARASHVCDFGVHDLAHGDISIWVGTTTGDLYIDRFVLAREPAAP